MRLILIMSVLVGAADYVIAGQALVLLNQPNATAVEEVRNGTRAEANAAWWGFDKNDSTEFLQAAIDSGAKMLLVPYMGSPWIVRPLQLRSDQQIVFNPGVVILAKRGEYRGGGDSLFTAVGRSNIVLRGYGATLRMFKHDYQNPPYMKAEWRMGIALRGCRHVVIEGLRVESTGGDGFYVDGGGGLEWSEDITLRNCVAYDNHRQGLSVISAENLLVENCRFANTWGTAPEAGIDLEPDSERQRLVNCVILNSVFENNNGNEILIHLSPLTTNSQPVSIRFENCLARMTEARLAAEGKPTNGLQGVAGIAVGAINDNGPKGLIEFIHCVVEDTGKECVRLYDKSATSTRVRFIDCSFRNPWIAAYPNDGAPRVPVMFYLRRPDRSAHVGGVDFQDCYLYDSVARPAVRFEADRPELGLFDVHGQIYRTGPGRSWMKAAATTQDVDLRVVSPRD